MIERVYIVFSEDWDDKEVVGVYQIEENANAEAERLNAKPLPHGYYSVEGHDLFPFQYCGRGPCWSPEGHEGECMADG